MAEVKITVRQNGAYRIKGPIQIFDADGNEYDLSERIIGDEHDGFIALCRCGDSATKPFCDGTHKSNGFDGSESP